jgi:hypothetical protein
MNPHAHDRWLRPALRAFTSLREVNLAATASRPLSLPQLPRKDPFVAPGAHASL